MFCIKQRSKTSDYSIKLRLFRWSRKNLWGSKNAEISVLCSKNVPMGPVQYHNMDVSDVLQTILLLRHWKRYKWSPLHFINRQFETVNLQKLITV